MAQNDAGELSPKQRRAIACLLSQPTVTQAAKAARVGRRTLQRWLREPVFRQAMTEAGSEELSLVAARLAGLLSKSLDVIGLDLEPGAGAAYRLRAASVVVRHVAGLLEFAGLEARVSVLEDVARKGALGNEHTSKGRKT